MKKIDARYWLALLVAVTLLVAAHGQHRLREAESQRGSAVARLEAAERRGDELRQLERQDAVLESRPRPPQDVIARINDVLAEVGLGTDKLKSLDSEGDSAVGTAGVDTGYRRQSLSLVLENLLPADLGQFLHAWRERHGTWVPSRVELIHRRSARPPAAEYDARILLTATYLADRFDAPDRGAAGNGPSGTPARKSSP